jgi:hypothetical protein
MRFGLPSFSNFGVQFSPLLGFGAWFVLVCVLFGIIGLYFLKLRRRPMEVPSTLLWRRSIEDLHVNSLFQRLRRNLLLVLQLLAVLLAMLALAGPQVQGVTGVGQRYVLTIDNSASMSATDVEPSRLARAKQEARKIVEAMGSNDLAMVISFADKARVVSNYTGNRGQLLARIDGIAPSQSSTSLREALQVAAGLANPSRQFVEGEVAADVIPPKLVIFTDGGFADVEGFSLGNLEPEVVVIGPLRPRSRHGSRPPTPGGSRARGRSPRTTSPSSRCRRRATRRGPTSSRSSAGSATTGAMRSRPRRGSCGTTRASPGGPVTWSMPSP